MTKIDILSGFLGAHAVKASNEKLAIATSSNETKNRLIFLIISPLYIYLRKRNI